MSENKSENVNLEIEKRIRQETLEEVVKWITEDLKKVRTTRKVLAAYYRIIWLIANENKQKSHLDEAEKTALKELRENPGFGMDDLAFIFNRSNSTIWEHLKQTSVSEEDVDAFLELRPRE